MRSRIACRHANASLACFSDGEVCPLKRALIHDGRMQSILAFSFLSGYILSFVFEGQILYSLLELHNVTASGYIMLAIAAQFLGLFTGGMYTKSAEQARIVMFFWLGNLADHICAFLFSPRRCCGVLGWLRGAYSSGAALAAWGYFLKAFTPRQERLRTCADVLIGSNIIMIALNLLSTKLSPFLGLALVVLSSSCSAWPASGR